MDTSDKCQHYMLTFELHRKICKRPSTEKWPGIPDTRKLHQIGNTGGKVLYFQNFSCCCFGCLHGTVPCQNNIYPSDFTAFDLGIGLGYKFLMNINIICLPIIMQEYNP